MTTLFSALPSSRSATSKTHAAASAEENNKVSSPRHDSRQTGSWTLAQEPPAIDKDELEAELHTMNDHLQLVSEVFPDIQPEVIREMLLNVSKESRAQIVTEHLLRDKEKWVRGRYRTEDAEDKRTVTIKPSNRTRRAIPRDETFRSKSYRLAVKSALYAEFRGLKHATIKAVLAECNSSYTQSRAILQDLSRKSWRFYLSNIWAKKRQDHGNPLVTWHEPYGGTGPKIPYLRQTDSHELNAELYRAYIEPRLQNLRAEQLDRDYEVARQLLQEEAAEAGALYDCECCYSSVVFEDLVTCSEGSHVVCFNCIRQTLNEALYGQGWTNTVDVDRLGLHCLALSDGCEAYITSGSIQDALAAGNADQQMLYTRLTDRIAHHNLDKCDMALLRCPFCPYAEADEVPSMAISDAAHIGQRLLTLWNGKSTVNLTSLSHPILLLLITSLLPLLHLATSLLQALSTAHFQRAQRRIGRKRRGLRFQCESPTCGVASCSVCLACWTDPHVCYETATSSLRQAIEAATTAVVKRTCPKCNMSFIKSDGCNKLVCPCGYVMCYVCRAPIGGEGYTHFCQHFRSAGGRCGECNRCDLYKVGDEEAIVKKAAAQAEQEWRTKEGQGVLQKLDRLGQDRLRHVRTEVMQHGQARWSWEGVLDAFLDIVLD